MGSRFNEILQGRYNRGLQKLLSMKGGPPAPSLGSEITPDFNVEDLPVELSVLFNHDRYVSGGAIGAQGASPSGVQLSNPLTSGVVAVIERLVLQVNPGGNNINVTVAFNNPAPLTNQFASTRRDIRSPAGVPIVFSASVGAVADLPVGVMTVNLSAFVPFEFIPTVHCEWPLLPGQAIRITSGAAVNVAFWFNYMLRMRQLDTAEALTST